MILRKPRKRPLSRAPDVYKKRNNSSPSHFSTARSTKTSYPNNSSRIIPLDKNSIPERIRDIDQQMKELFIIDSHIDEFSSSLKSSLLSVSNTKQQKSTGEAFFTFWNTYVQSITAYLRQPTVKRCLNYVLYYFNKAKEVTQLLFSHINVTSASSSGNNENAKIEKNQTDLNNSLSALQQLIDNASNILQNNNSDEIKPDLSNQIIGKLSNMTYPFDCFYHEIKSKYTFFFETVIPEKKIQETHLNDLSKSIKNIVDCTFSASKLDDLKKRFIENLNDSSDIFNQIFKRATIRNLSSTGKINHKHKSISYFTQEPTSTREVTKNRNKTDAYFRENIKPSPRRRVNSQKNRTQSDESSSGIDNIVTIDEPSESITDDIKIPQKPQINRVMMTLSKIKYDHLNRKFNNENQQQHSRNPNKPLNHINTNSNNRNINSQVSLLSKKNSKRSSSTLTPGEPSSYPSRIRPSSFINHNNNASNNNKNANNNRKNNASGQKNNSSSNNSGNLTSQIYLNRGKEAQLLAQIEQISQQNDQLRQKRDQLAEMVEKAKQDSRIDSLKREIKILEGSLAQMKTENSGNSGPDIHSNQHLEVELVGEIQTLRELVDSIKETNGLLADEIEPCQQINNGILSPINLDDTTVTFDNMRLKKVCEEMREKLRKRMARLDEIRRQNRKSLMISEIMNGQQLSNDEKIAVFNFVIMDSKLARRENERLEGQLKRYQDQISSNNSSMSLQNSIGGELKFPVPISFSKDYNAPIRKLFSRINQLEEKVQSHRKSRNCIYNILIDQLFKTKNAIMEVKRLDKEISQKIDKYIQIGETAQVKRKIFDNYEVLKEKSRELKIKYSALKNSITDRMTTSQRYDIELQMDNVQDIFTCVMMEIERIGNQMITSQESLKECRKGRSRIRREMKKYMDQEYQVAVDCLNAEKRVSGFEIEASNLLNKGNDLNKEDLYVSKISEALVESVQTKEIINLIDDQAKEFNLELEPNQAITEKQRIEDLKDTVEKLINSGGPKMRQKLRIYNLRKEIESYQ